MPTRRRTLLAVLVPFLAGCGSESTLEPTARPTATPRPTTRDQATTDPGRSPASASAEATGSVTVVNDGGDDRYVTVAVERAGETVFVDSRTVRGGTSRRFTGVVSDPGDYRVVVDTASGTRGRFGWTTTDALGELRVELGAEVTFSQVVRCDPDCRGVSLGGSSTGYPEGGFDPRGRRAGSTLRVRNDANEARTADVRVADGAVLDYRYRVPPTTTLEIPVPQRSGETRVEVGSPESRETYEWSMEVTPVLDAAVGSTVRFTCGGQNRSLQMLNEDDVPHRLSVEVTDPSGEPVFTGTYDLEPGESVREADAVSTAGDYGLSLATEDSSVSYDWSTCPGRGPVYVVVQADGTVGASVVVPI